MMGLFNGRELDEIKRLKSIVINLENDKSELVYKCESTQQSLYDSIESNSKLLKDNNCLKEDNKELENMIDYNIEQFENYKNDMYTYIKNIKNENKELKCKRNLDVKEYKKELNSINEECNLLNIKKLNLNDIINNLNNDISNKNTILSNLDEKILNKNEELKNLAKIKANEYMENERNIRREYLNKEFKTLEDEIDSLINKKEECIFLHDSNLFKNTYEYESSKEYQDKLNEIKDMQRETVRDNSCIHFDNTWEINGSKSDGNKFMKDMCKFALRSFNNECDNIIMNLKYNSIHTSKDRMIKSLNLVNKLTKTFHCNITSKYLNLKIKELELKMGYINKKEEEKQELRRQLEIIKEEDRVKKEIEKEENKINVEQEHYDNELNKLNNLLLKDENSEKLIEKIKELESKIEELEKRKEDVLNRKINNRAGYVYIISNPSFDNDNMYKIGVTRRLDPNVRIDELSSASVPFKFGVHSFIFSDDAFKLEHALHLAFDDKRINKVNKQKEFFEVTLDEIKREVFKHNPTTQFIDNVVVKEYLESIEINKKSN